MAGNPWTGYPPGHDGGETEMKLHNDVRPVWTELA